MTARRYTDYDPFAWLYNKYWGTEFLPSALAVMDRVLLPHLPEAARLLDLCCGTGQLARVLSDRGYRVAGVDGSAKMLAYARKNAPQVEFLLDDARSFKLRNRYDAVVCMFDSLNHVMSADDLGLVFRCVSSVLSEGGLFLFDLNLEPGYLADWNGVYGIVESDHVCIIRNDYDPSAHVAKFEATLFRMRDGWRRSDFTLLQRCYPLSDVIATLAAEDFVDIRTYDYRTATGLSEVTAESGRAFFLCRKR